MERILSSVIRYHKKPGGVLIWILALGILLLGCYSCYGVDELPALYTLKYCVPLWRAAVGTICMIGGIFLGIRLAIRTEDFGKFFYGLAIFIIGGVVWLGGQRPCEEACNDGSHNAERKYSAPDFVISEKKSVTGFPDMRLASTSHVERLNGTTRLHMRRLTRLTYAFSKKNDKGDSECLTWICN